jgi:hypothetical protein
MDGYKEFIARIGDFFLVMGFFLFLLFVSSDLAKHAEFDYLFLSILTLGIAWVLRRRRPRRPAAGRFAWYNKTRGSMKDRSRKSREKK